MPTTGTLTTPLSLKVTVDVDDILASGYDLITAVQVKVAADASTLDMKLKEGLEAWLTDVMGVITYPGVHDPATNLFMLVYDRTVTPKLAMVRLECVLGAISAWHAAIENQRHVSEAKIRATEQPPIVTSAYGLDRI